VVTFIEKDSDSIFFKIGLNSFTSCDNNFSRNIFFIYRYDNDLILDDSRGKNQTRIITVMQNKSSDGSSSKTP